MVVVVTRRQRTGHVTLWIRADGVGVNERYWKAFYKWQLRVMYSGIYGLFFARESVEVGQCVGEVDDGCIWLLSGLFSRMLTWSGELSAYSWRIKWLLWNNGWNNKFFMLREKWGKLRIWKCFWVSGFCKYSRRSLQSKLLIISKMRNIISFKGLSCNLNALLYRLERIISKFQLILFKERRMFLIFNFWNSHYIWKFNIYLWKELCALKQLKWCNKSCNFVN